MQFKQNPIDSPTRMLENYHRKLHKVSIFCVYVSALLFYNIYKWTSTADVIVKNPQFSLLEPSNSTLPPIEDVYDQLIDLKRFTFITNPQPCQNYTAGLFLLILVISKPSHFENRALIRTTWGVPSDSIKVVFLLGQTIDSDTHFTENLERESSLYGDIIMGSFVDAYRNMTYKHVMALKWVANHCPSAKYILKTDDDTVVSINTLVKFLSRELSPWGAKDLILCDITYHAPVLRTESKWTVTNQEYANDYYPNYCRGFAVVYSQDVIPRLLKAAQNSPFFWIDDVHITGTLAQNLTIKQTGLGSLVLTPLRAKVLTFLRGGKHAGPFLFGSWNLSVLEMLQVWSSVS